MFFTSRAPLPCFLGSVSPLCCNKTKVQACYRVTSAASLAEYRWTPSVTVFSHGQTPAPAAFRGIWMEMNGPQQVLSQALGS